MASHGPQKYAYILSLLNVIIYYFTRITCAIFNVSAAADVCGGVCVQLSEQNR